jgi:hypothetical protein
VSEIIDKMDKKYDNKFTPIIHAVLNACAQVLTQIRNTELLIRAGDIKDEYYAIKIIFDNEGVQSIGYGSNKK